MAKAESFIKANKTLTLAMALDKVGRSPVLTKAELDRAFEIAAESQRKNQQ